MGRLKITQEDDSIRTVAYLDEVQDLANDVDANINKIGVLTEKVKPETLLNTTSQNLTGAVNEVNSEIVSAKQSTVKNKTFGSLDARLEESEQELIQHKLDYASQFNEGFPSQAKDLKNNKTYTIKLQLSSEGNPQLISKEVI